MKNRDVNSVTQEVRVGNAALYTPEFELLLSTARTVPDEERIQALVDSSIDWRAFLDLATRHGVRLLVYKSLRSVCWDRVPDEIRTEWTNAYGSITGKNLFIVGELLRINSAFQSAEISVAVMKGALIAQTAYGDCALREFHDLDLLIQPDDFLRSIQVLRQLGYQPVWKYDPAKVFRFLRHIREFNFTSDFLHTDVDLHWGVATRASALSPRVGDFPSGFQPVGIADSTVLSFAPQELPLYLASQGGWDQWLDLRRICDLAEFLRRYPRVDWESNIEIARRLGGLRSLLTGLMLASTLLGAELPESVRRPIREDQVVSRLAKQAARNLNCNYNPGEPVSRYLFQIRAKQGLRGKLGLTFSILTDRTSQDGNWVMLPSLLWWLYPLLRPLRMTGKFLRRS